MECITCRSYFKFSFLLIIFLVVLPFRGIGKAAAAEKEYQHLVILGDPHLPGDKIKIKEQVIATINTWDDVDMIIAVGDICKERGTDEEYTAAKEFFAKLKKPLYPIVGNHDYLYADSLDIKGKKFRAVTETREAKLSRFRETFGLKEISYSKMAGRYLLIFLSIDSAGYLAELSQKQLDWLNNELEKSKKTPTIIFSHAPLAGTLRSYNKNANTSNFVAQPIDKIHNILMNNPQVFLWASGHTHTSPKEESFASITNIYEKRITNIHNTDMERETIWTNSLFLYPDKIIVKTFNHKKGTWLPEFERTILAPTKL